MFWQHSGISVGNGLRHCNGLRLLLWENHGVRLLHDLMLLGMCEDEQAGRSQRDECCRGDREGLQLCIREAAEE